MDILLPVSNPYESAVWFFFSGLLMFAAGPSPAAKQGGAREWTASDSLRSEHRSIDVRSVGNAIVELTEMGPPVQDGHELTSGGC